MLVLSRAMGLVTLAHSIQRIHFLHCKSNHFGVHFFHFICSLSLGGFLFQSNTFSIHFIVFKTWRYKRKMLQNISVNMLRAYAIRPLKSSSTMICIISLHTQHHAKFEKWEINKKERPGGGDLHPGTLNRKT